MDGPGDGPNAGGVSESQDDTTADDQLNPGEGEGSNGDADVDNSGQDDNADKNQSDTDDNTDADNTNPDEADSDNTDIDDNADSDETDPDEDEPAADDPVDDDESEKNTLAQEDGSKEYYLVAFQRESADAAPADGTPMYSVDTRNNVLSEDVEYIFIEWDGEDASQPRQEYPFDGKEIWCKITFKSNEWFKKYVLNMDKVDY